MSALVSVIVATYNPDWTKFRNTLRSIICQKNVDFDIVISDDGSKVDHFDKVEQFFQENNFHAYKLVKNIENQGTVKNSILALQNTDSKYVKGISPGDFLYDENALFRFVDFAEKNPADAYFGNAVFYSVNEKNAIKLYEDKHNPKDYTPWIKKDLKRIRKNYIISRDYILGASFLCKRTLYLDYVKRLDNIIKYAEDFSFVWYVADNRKILYLDSPFVFYEFGSGISTNSSDKWRKILRNDNLNGFEIMYQNNSISFLELQYFKNKNRFIKLLLKLYLDPISLLKKFRNSNTTITIDVEESKEKLKLILE